MTGACPNAIEDCSGPNGLDKDFGEFRGSLQTPYVCHGCRRTAMCPSGNCW